MKKIIVCFIMLSCFLLLTSCSKALSQYAGTYNLEYYKFVGDTYPIYNSRTYESIILNDDGTGKNNRDGQSFDIEWQIKGDNDIYLVEFVSGETIEYSGTITEERLDLFDGDKNDSLTNEKVYIKE